MKKVSFQELSDRPCSKCGKLLKKNLVSKRPNAHLCYKCYRKAKP
jgi:formamidopyrimidine-DNA glycosylase